MLIASFNCSLNYGSRSPRFGLLRKASKCKQRQKLKRRLRWSISNNYSFLPVRCPSFTLLRPCLFGPSNCWREKGKNKGKRRILLIAVVFICSLWKLPTNLYPYHQIEGFTVTNQPWEDVFLPNSGLISSRFYITTVAVRKIAQTTHK